MENFPDNNLKNEQNSENTKTPVNEFEQVMDNTPSFEEHMNAQFDKNNAPEGVRDEQDFAEYNEKIERKTEEAKEFFEQNFRGNFDIEDEELDEFLNSEELKNVAGQLDVSMDDLRDAGIIRTEIPSVGVSDEKLADIVKPMLFDDARRTIQQLGWDLNNRFVNSSDLAKVIKKCGLVKERLNSDDYRVLDSVISPLKDKLLFGDQFADEFDAFYRTTNTLKNKEYEWDDLWNVGSEVEKQIQEGRFSADVYEMNIKDALCDWYGKNLPKCLREYTDSGEEVTDEDKDMMLKAVDGWVARENHDAMIEAGFTDEEMLDSIYHLTHREVYYEREPGRNMARHFGDLERDGFERENIINALRDNNVHFGKKEIEYMRRAGVSDEDIIYAGRFYIPFNNRHNTLFREVNFTPEDQVKAMYREIMEQEKIIKDGGKGNL